MGITLLLRPVEDDSQLAIRTRHHNIDGGIHDRFVPDNLEHAIGDSIHATIDTSPIV